MITSRYTYTATPRAEINGVRHYCLPDGSKVASVTTILSATQPPEKKAALQQWRDRVGHAKAQEITTQAAGRGTRMHKWLENYVLSDKLGEPGTNPYSKQSHGMARQVIDSGLVNVNEYWGVEVPLYYSGLYAGTTDCVGVWNGVPAILDFKQSNKPKKVEWIDDYFLQLAAYSEAHNNMHGTNINTGVILMCSPAPSPVEQPVYQEFTISGSRFDFYIGKWWDRVEQYYKQH
ncbi:hypothetical protein UFOVP116_81 [uncultured Caudovirales phage]|uniref:PD-(D/E)XK nuclease superfamily n=1 Tax=uncultured Caudovirales phage TaxID=2100421 RepID=A0A6J5L6K0_9CAUD|nr:hypothetical protein UFOVP116_81 [uncultured Caudovirales phage]